MVYEVPKTDEEFERMLFDNFRPKLRDDDLADELGFSRSTVSRWVNGHNRPHRAIWPAITAWINEKLRGN